jgi:hypothetical protein
MQSDFVNGRYEEGKAELAKLITAAHILKTHELSTGVALANSPHAEREHTLPGKFSEENALLNSREIFHEKLLEHDAKCEAYLRLSEHYNSLGLESDSKAYQVRAQMETATSQGFQAVMKSCDKKLKDLGIHQIAEKPQSLNHHLEMAQRYLEDHKNSHAISSVYIQQVADNRQVIQQFETDEGIRALSPEEMKQFAATLHQRDSYVALAEQESIKAAVSYKSFQDELDCAERFYEGLNREKQSAAIKHDSHEPPSPAKSGKNDTFSPERERIPIHPPINGHRFGLSKAEAFRQMVNEINREL